MKSMITIEVISPDKYEMVFPEEGETLDDYKGRLKELRVFQSDFAHQLHKDLLDKAKNYFLKQHFEDDWLDYLEELSVEGWDSFDDYKVTIDVK